MTETPVDGLLQPPGKPDEVDGDIEKRVEVRSLNIACVGAGSWGRNLIRNFNELSRLSWVCDERLEQLSPMAGEYPQARLTQSLQDVLGDPEVQGVVIATPAATHGRLAAMALEAGKDVFVEKPLCLSVSEGRDLARKAEAGGLVLMVGHLLWYHSAILKLKNIVDCGELGRIQYIYSQRLNLGKIRREENILWSFAPHDISVILGLLGETPNAVQTQGGAYLQDRIPDATVSLLSFPSGVKAHVFVSWLHPFKEQKLVVVGDRQMAVFDDLQEQEQKLTLYPHSISWNGRLPVANRAEANPVNFEWVEPLKAEAEHFLECMLYGRTPRTDAREALSVLSVLEACQKGLEAVAAPVQDQREQPPLIEPGAQIGEGTIVRPSSAVLKGSRVGRDCRIGRGVVIGPRAVIGNGVKVQDHVSVYEGVTLEDHVFCGPSVVFTNVMNPRSEIPRMGELRPTLVKQGATLGANCTILPGVTIGRYAFIGAGSVVLHDVPDFALVVGNPARLTGWVCSCAGRIDFAAADGDGVCRDCRQKYLKLGETVKPIP